MLSVNDFRAKFSPNFIMTSTSQKSSGLLSLPSFVCLLALGFLICNNKHTHAEALTAQSVFESIGSDPESADMDKPPHHLLLSDPVFQDERDRTGPKWDNVVMLSRSLRKIGELDAYFTHKGRSRYG
ncbi:hypothetical protein RvY_12941 [Ramazzottius varieornatus]|uniref:Uncharacterized protein n=1 Tax=Ramazzottius varieornatus TaxID=947166 RepID=A0A1D1VL66_RAMVA|nr:hypothetical protein RvY_12941 [Ramazzottius varieornatus]